MSERSGVVMMRFGLKDGQPKTLKNEISKVYGVTRERIRQIESNMSKLHVTRQDLKFCVIIWNGILCDAPTEYSARHLQILEGLEAA